MSAKPQDLMMTLMLAEKAGGMDDETKAALKYVVAQQVAEIKALQAGREADAKQAVLLAKDIQRKKDAARKGCSHTAGSRGTRCRGQWLPNKQLFLVCSRCFTEFHNPPIKELGQHAAPPHLIPAETAIGGPMGSMQMM